MFSSRLLQQAWEFSRDFMGFRAEVLISLITLISVQISNLLRKWFITKHYKNTVSIRPKEKSWIDPVLCKTIHTCLWNRMWNIFTNHASVQNGSYLENWNIFFFCCDLYKRTQLLKYLYKACTSFQWQVRIKWVWHWS